MVGETRQQHEDDATESTEQGTGDTTEAFQEQPPETEVEEIEAERERRLAPENRPENAEIDNSGAELPTVKEFEELNAGDAQEGSAGTADPSEIFREMKPSEDEVAEIEAERERRLDPENRPDNAEVDSTGDGGTDGDAGSDVAKDEA